MTTRTNESPAPQADNDELRMLRERLGPRGLEVIEIDGRGHYVNEVVKTEIVKLRAENGYDHGYADGVEWATMHPSAPAPQAEFQPTRVSEDKYLGSRTDDELEAHFAKMYHGWERGLNITQERSGNGDTTFTETPMTEMELAARYVAAEIGLNIFEIANKAAFAPIIVYSQIQARLGPVFEGLEAAAPPAPQAKTRESET